MYLIVDSNFLLSFQCWLKKQQDALNPDRRDSGDLVMWTSGLVFRKGEVGILFIVVCSIKLFYLVCKSIFFSY